MQHTATLSLLIGMLATAGAVPLVRRIVLARSEQVESPAIPAVVSVAGAGMFAGGLLALFYSEAFRSTLAAPVLAALGLALLAGGLERDERRRGGRPWHRRTLLIGSVAVMAALLAVITPHEPLLEPIHSLVMVLALLTPYATTRMAVQPDRPSTPSAVALVQGLLLLAVVVLGSIREPGGAPALVEAPAAAHLGAFVGVLLGALVYQCRMPWREQPIASCSVSARLVLGLFVAWFAVDLGSSPSTDGRGGMALLWILSVPFFELVRESLSAARVAPPTASMPTSGAGRTAAASPFVLALATSLCGAVGIALWLGNLPSVWAIAAWGLALVAWAVVPVLARTIARASGPPTSTLDRL